MRSLILVSLFALGCGGTGENIDRLGCDKLAAASFTPVAATDVRDASAAAIVAGTAYEVALPAASRGYLRFDSLDDTDYAIFFDRTVPFAVFQDDGTEVMLSASGTSSTVCTAIRGRHIFELPAISAYLGLGPDAGGPVHVVLEVYNPD